MREIKFKLWLPNEKKMTYAFDITDLPDKTQTTDGMIYLQFTGLKDKNGKEIYEGDIITMTSYNYQHMNNIKWEVMYYPEGMSFKFHSLNDRKEAYEDTVGWHSFEVIGNIYENPLPPS